MRPSTSIGTSIQIHSSITPFKGGKTMKSLLQTHTHIFIYCHSHTLMKRLTSIKPFRNVYIDEDLRTDLGFRFLHSDLERKYYEVPFNLHTYTVHHRLQHQKEVNAVNTNKKGNAKDVLNFIHHN